MSDWPVIHVYPNGTPSDAELEAERDAKHANAVREYRAGQNDPDCPLCGWECHGYCTWPVTEVRF